MRDRKPPRSRKRRSFWMNVDGEPIHVLTGGADVSELTERDLEALREIARAAKKRMEKS